MSNMDFFTIFKVIADQYLTTFLHTLSVVSALLLYNTTKTATNNKIHQIVTLLFPLLLTSTCLHGKISFPFHLSIWILAFYKYRQVKTKTAESQDAQAKSEENDLISIFRVYILFFSIVGILAIDFSVAPRAIGKSKTFGASAMDTGVGAFIASNAFASSDSKYKGMAINLPKMILKLAPILFIAFGRLVAVFVTGYPVDNIEYGFHWNFFFSLFIAKLFGQILVRSLSRVPPAVIGVTIAAIYEIKLSDSEFMEYLLDFAPQRHGFLDQNKEGFYSSFGMLSLYLIFVQIGRFLLPRTKQGFNFTKTCAKLSVMAWVAVFIINCFGHMIFHSFIWPSRRIGNFGYTIWMIATMLGLLASCSLGNDLRCHYSFEMPSLLKRMNQTQLPIFMLANLLTGMINLSMQTKKQSTITGYAILSSYLIVLCYASHTIMEVPKLKAINDKLFQVKSRSNTIKTH